MLCNSILPVRPPQATDDWASARAAYHAAVERHFGRVAQLGGRGAGVALAAAASTSSYASPSSRALRSSRFQLAAHDARLLLLRLAHNEPLHQESGGGSRRSNLELCLYLLQMAGHQLQDRDAGGAADAADAQREGATSPRRRRFSRSRPGLGGPAQADGRGRAHAALLALFSASNDRWSVQRKRRACARALKQSVDRAKSRAAASAAARAGGAAPALGPASPPNSPQRPPIRRRRAAPPTSRPPAARAFTYARATLAYVALVDKLQSVLATPLVPAATVITPAEGRISLFGGDDAGIGRCAAELASFYDSQLRDAEAPQDVLRVMDLDADALDIDTETRSMVFGS